MSRFVILMVTLVTISAFGASRPVDGDGRFSTKDSDSLNFVKKQLLASAFKNVITKEMKNLNLDANLFWEKYDSKFDSFFDPIQEGLRKRYKINDPENKATYDDKKNFQKALRAKRLTLRASYGRLNKAIKKYKVKRMTRSPKVPSARYITVTAWVDRQILQDIYLNFTTENISRHFQDFYITTNWKLKGMSWTDVGVEIQEDFTNVVNLHWKEYFKNKLNGQIERVVLANENKVSEIKNFLKLPKSSVENVAMSRENYSSSTSMNPLYNSLWIEINFNLEKEKEAESLDKKSFSISGDFIVHDLMNQEIVHFKELESVRNTFSIQDKRQLSSNIASLIANKPLPYFEEIRSKMSNLSVGKNHVTIEINNFDSVKDLIDFQNWLNLKGILKQFNARLKNYGKEKAFFSLEYIGTSSEIADFFNSLNQTKFNNKISLELKEPKKPFQITFNRLIETQEQQVKEEVNL